MLGINYTSSRHSRGFTLIEMSIVLVIIGLIIGGILKGQEIIESSRQKNVISQVDAVRSSVNTFADRFNALPGDYNLANTRVSSILSAGGNGNASGIIGSAYTTTATLSTAANTGENAQFFNHLSAAELLAGSQVNGTAASFGDGSVLPSTAIPGTGMTVIFGEDASAADGRRAHWLRIHKNAAGGTSNATDGAMIGRRLAEVDLKIDDGNHRTGTTRVMNAAAVADCNSLTGYTVNSGSATCVPFFELLQ